MNSLIRKSMMLGIGITALTKDKVEKIVNELRREGEINAKEGKELIEYFLSESEKKQKELSAIITKHIKEAFNEAELVTKEEINTIRKRLDEAENRVKEKVKQPIKKSASKTKQKAKKPLNKISKKKGR